MRLTSDEIHAVCADPYADVEEMSDEDAEREMAEFLREYDLDAELERGTR